MDAAGCPMNGGGDAFVVLLCGDRGEHHRRPELPTTGMPVCPANRPSTPPAPQHPPVAAADAYKTKPRRKDRGAFVVLPEPPAANASSSQTEPNAAAAAAARSGRVSPFRGNGFKTPENGRSRAASPSSQPLRRQSSEPRISANRQRPPAKQRLSVSTKDLSKSWKPTTTVNKPPPAPTTAAAAAVKSSPRKKLPTGGPLQPRKVTSSSKSPLPPAGSPKTPRHSRPPAKSPVVSRRPPPAKSSPRLPKKQQTNVLPSKDNDTQPPAVTATTSATTPAVATSTTAATAAVRPTATASTPSTTDPSPPMAPTITPAAPVTTTTASSIAPVAAAAAQSSVTASTSATAIATTHATNAVASPVVTGGPIVSAAPPPAAIAANTLLAVNPSAITALKPPQSAMRSREQFFVVKNGNLPTSTVETPVVRQSAEPTTTTPPLSYELQEIVVEPEMENQSGRTNAAVRLSDIEKTSSNNNNSNNGHKTVAWARHSEKIIVATDVPRSAEMAATAETKYPDCKRFARKLLCGGGGGKELAPVDGRPQKCWAAVWKCRPRLSNRWCYGQNDAGRQSRTAAAAAVTTTTRPAAVAAAKPPRPLRWWRRWPSCRCAVCGKRNGDGKSTSAESVGVLGISPPTVPPPTSGDTLRGRLLRWLTTCCGCCHAAPRLFRRVCRCRCLCCAGRGPLLQQDAPRKSADRRSPFKCATGCCTNKPAKLDAVLVDHSSVMKGAIPVLPIILAWFCLVFNVIVPGAGTFFSGLMCLCVGKPRFSVNDNFQSRMGAFCVNFIVAVAQLFTVLFCLVGWGWSIWWGLIMIKMAKKYQKIKVVDQPVETPIAIDHNHQI